MTAEKDKLRDGLPENVHSIVDDMETAWEAINQGASADVRRLSYALFRASLQVALYGGDGVSKELKKRALGHAAEADRRVPAAST